MLAHEIPVDLIFQDLKKQTALRLAQEQQQKLGDGYFVDLSTTTIRQPLADQQVPVFGQFAPSATFLVQHSPSGYPVAPISGATMIIYPNATPQFSNQLQLQQNAHQQGVYNRLSEEYVENRPNFPHDNQQQVLTRCRVRTFPMCFKEEYLPNLVSNIRPSPHFSGTGSITEIKFSRFT